ncbi:uncharacterized protein im:7147486 [Engraulis encrasicolus]|uniref:uncharacterized protein im:7147486 n=1 Tax=Engraulis encrasicolus TaxID=184585 RepID=UPI002FD662BB
MFDLEKNTASSPDPPPVKTYRCVACSATFHGLASLLVHQASHATDFSSPVPPSPPTCSRCGTVFANRDLLNQHVCAASLPSTAPDSSTGGDGGSGGEDGKDISASVESKLSPHNQESDKSHPKTEQPGASPTDFNAPLSPKPSTSHPVPSHSSSSSAAADMTSDPVTMEEPHQDGSDNPPQQSHVHIHPQDQSTAQSSSLSASQVKTQPQVTCAKCFMTFDSHSKLLNHMSCHGTPSAPKMHMCPHCGISFLSIYSLELHSNKCKPPVSFQSNSVQATPNCTDSVSKINASEDIDLQSDISKSNSMASEAQQPTSDSAELDLPLSDTNMQNSLSGSITEESPDISKNSDNPSEDAEVKQTSKSIQDKPDRKKMLMKILANAYMNVKQPHDLKLKQDSACEDEPAESDEPTSPKRLLRPAARKSYDTTFPLGFLFHGRTPPKKPVGLMTKRYCPVVLLETRQKFGRSVKDAQGNYQCGQCKRLFSDLDKLVLHHAMHRKDRLKRCHRCKQFTVSKSGLEVPHVCSRASASPARGHISNGKTLAGSHKSSSKLAKNNPFQCPLCKNSYTRLYSLKKHKCLGKPSSKHSHAAMNVGPEVEINGSEGNSSDYVSVGVGTHPPTWLKKEVPTPLSVAAADKHQTKVSNDDGPSVSGNEACSPSEPIISDTRASTPSNTSEAAVEDDLDFDMQTDTIQQVDPAAELAVDYGLRVKQEQEEVRGIMSPVEDEAEIDVLLEADEDDYDHNDGLDQSTKEGVAVSKTQQDAGPIDLSDDQGKRFTCGHCHKAFTRNYGLKKHAKICGFGRIAQPRLKNLMAHKMFGSQKGFDCAQCGKTFNDIESFAVHKATCLSGMILQNKLTEPPVTASQESVFVLPPRSNTQTSRPEPAPEDDSSWGIMSLPSVLPRRVTCECGAGFTCPRRLFEHLQMHARESYICPHCGENLQSWMRYEAHLRTHAQVPRPPATEESFQLYQPMYQQQPQPYLPRPPKHQFNTQLSSQRLAGQILNQSPHTCPKCFRTFKTRRYLLKHVRRSCPAARTEPKMYTCSQCGMSFLSTYTLELHMKSNTCTPSLKPMRCPVCVLSFTSVEGLKQHLVTHSQQGGFSCRLCPQTFASEKELESHNKTAHVAPQEERELQKEDNSQVNPFKFFRCNMCPRVYHSMKSLKDHRRKVHTLLGGSLAAPSPEVRVVSQNNPVSYFRCQLCPRAYHSLQSLKNHKKRVHQLLESGQVPQGVDSLGALPNSASNIFRCEICQRAYPTVKAWRNHRRRVHRILGGPEMPTGESLRNVPKQAQPGVTCKTCRKTYPSLGSLKEHRRTAHRSLAGLLEPQMGDSADGMQNSHAMVYQCQICHRSYGKLQSLKDHRRKVHRIPGGRLDVIKIE